MIYISLTTIPERFKNLNKTISSLLSQKKKADKIFINIPNEFRRFKEKIIDNEIPKFSENVEINLGTNRLYE